MWQGNAPRTQSGTYSEQATVRSYVAGAYIQPPTIGNPGTDYATRAFIARGREAKDISAAEARNYIFGYVCINDVSDRSTQVDTEHRQHLVRAKSRPTYSPTGPYLTTDVDASKLDVWTKLNGKFEQQGNTSDMLFGVDEMVAYFSTHGFTAVIQSPHPRARAMRVGSKAPVAEGAG